ncbi:MarR family transcriptional regulator [Staphylococcus epidermidis]|uniref:MarR family winged helix-turn-helix transcriptional regulator n=1 Tax=Staphylococcus epidermidis TaxID=1282 RepID=UPI00187A30E9|nr:MarR family transcriptional regulator [Staphylococcus epidermidis]MBE7347636.1 MarR family transcriptional regulator [Staphylococcus epidermidis]MCG2254588.1 MarR family transcriptional regulator [Staphylococcus epidermidis]
MKDIANQTMFEIQDIALKSKQYADNAIQDLGLSAQQGRIINYIYTHQNQSVSQKELADHFNVSTASIGGSLKVLEKYNYIERTKRNDNARQYQIVVLPKGESIIQDFEEKMSNLYQEFSTFLTEDEFKSLLSLLTQLKSKF